MYEKKGINYTPRTRFNLRINKGLLDRLQQIREQRHTTLANVVEELLEKALAQ